MALGLPHPQRLHRGRRLVGPVHAARLALRRARPVAGPAFRPPPGHGHGVEHPARVAPGAAHLAGSPSRGPALRPVADAVGRFGRPAVLLVLPGTGGGRLAARHPLSPRRVARGRRDGWLGVGRPGALDRRARRGSRRRPAARRLQGVVGRSEWRVRRRPLGMVAAPELLLRVGHVVRLRGVRARRAARLDRARRPRADAPSPPRGHRRAGGRGLVARLAR